MFSSPVFAVVNDYLIKYQFAVDNREQLTNRLPCHPKFCTSIGKTTLRILPRRS